MKMGNGFLSTAFYATAIRFSDLLFSVITAIIIANVLGVEGLGEYSLLIALAALISMPLEFGVSDLITRKVASSNNLDDWKEISGILISSSLFLFLISIVGLIAIDAFKFTYIGLSSDYIVLAVFLAVLNSLINICSAILYGLHRVIISQIPGSVGKSGLLLFFLLLSSYLERDLSMVEIIHCQILISCLIILITAPFTLFICRASIFYGVSFQLKNWLKSAFQLGLIRGFRVIQPQVALMIIGATCSIEIVGLYRVAMRGAQLGAIMISVISSISCSKIALYYSKKMLNELQCEMKKYARFAFSASLFSTVVFLLFGRWILDTVFGSDFSDAYFLLIAASFTHLIATMYGFTDLLINMTSKESYGFKSLHGSRTNHFDYDVVPFADIWFRWYCDIFSYFCIFNKSFLIFSLQE